MTACYTVTRSQVLGMTSKGGTRNSCGVRRQKNQQTFACSMASTVSCLLASFGLFHGDGALYNIRYLTYVVRSTTGTKSDQCTSTQQHQRYGCRKEGHAWTAARWQTVLFMLALSPPESMADGILGLVARQRGSRDHGKSRQHSLRLLSASATIVAAIVYNFVNHNNLTHPEPSIVFPSGATFVQQVKTLG
eukprot:6186378-Pleurochrysis_carterae.AAC.2